MEFQIPVVQLDPLVPLHRAQAHCDVVLSVPEGAVGDRFGGVDVEVGVGGYRGAGEGDGGPLACRAGGCFEGGGGGFDCWVFFEVGGGVGASSGGA